MIMDAAVEKYLYDLLPEGDAKIREMEAYGREHNFPIVGPLVGQFLYQMARTINAKRVLELGSGYGYSAYWFAKAVGKDGKVICTDLAEKNLFLCEKYFANDDVAAGVVRYEVGDALQILDRLEGPFDIVFMDIRKNEYTAAFEKAFPLLRVGGLFMADNVLRKGQVADKNPDELTAAIMEFNKMIFSHPKLISSINPIRDGVLVSLKIAH
jgi:predicted O-methyltransferase YrrM